MSRVRDLADNNIVFVDGISTLDITENNNLFFTNARADARIAAATTTDLTEGTNLYFTNARADARAQIKVDAIVGAAPGTLDTLQELGDALGDDPNFATTVTNSIATKLPLAGGTMTGDVTFNTQIGIGAAPHATAPLTITTTNQHIRLNNGSELGVISVLSSGELDIWGHGDNESINFRTGSGVGTIAMNVVGTNVGIGTSSPEETLSVMGDFQVALNTSVTGRGLKVSTSNTSITDDTVTMNAQAATGILAFQTNSLERMRIDPNGKIFMNL